MILSPPTNGGPSALRRPRECLAYLPAPCAAMRWKVRYRAHFALASEGLIGASGLTSSNTGSSGKEAGGKTEAADDAACAIPSGASSSGPVAGG
jgi:hypothetical protein